MKDWDKVKKYSDTKQRTDDLFFEYIRILRGLKPKVFIGENVSGLIKGASKGYFKEFLKKFKQSGYRVKCYVVNAKHLGVPQNRERVFFIGVRKDLKGDPTIPKPLPYTYTLRDAIWNLRKRKPEIDTWLDRKPDGTPFYYATAYQWDKLSEGQQSDKFFNLIKCHWDKPCNTITAVSGKKAASVTHPTERRKFSIAELKRICAFPDDFKLTGKFEQQWERLGRAVPPPVLYFISKKLWTSHKARKERNKKREVGFGYGLVTPESSHTRTLSARYYKDGSEILLKVNGSKTPRKLTPRECARLQGFPNSFRIPVSDIEAYKQFGNSVSVPVVKEIALEILQRI